jgi:casein kinase II subunit alpha
VDCPNVIQLLDVLFLPDHDMHCLVFEYVGPDLKSLALEYSPDTIRWILRSVLQGLDQAHSRGIMHRDVKPHNIVACTTSRRVKLIDWGLAEFYQPLKNYNVKVSSRTFKAP